jgi:hypothetical protein
MPTCKGARLKIERADHHVADLEASIDGLKKRLATTVHVDPDTGCEYIKCDFASIGDRDAIENVPGIIGDAVHNLKCALDHVWFETVQRLIPFGDWDRTMFPAYPTENHLEPALRKSLIHISAPELFNFIMGEIKPYDGGNFAVWSVHILDRRDKHRLLIPVVHYSSIGDIEVEQNGESSKGFTWGTTDPLPHYVHYKRGIHVKNPGRASFDVMFQEEDAGKETRAVDTLRVYSRFILQIVKLLEEFTE